MIANGTYQHTMCHLPSIKPAAYQSHLNVSTLATFLKFYRISIAARNFVASGLPLLT